MKLTVADAFRGKLDDGKIVIEFGQSDPPGGGGDGSTVSLLERIEMPPHTAKRLLVALDDALRQHAPALRAGAEPTPDSSLAAEVLRRGQIPVNAPPDEAGEKAALLLRLVADLGIPYQYERSFRIARNELLANRFLLTFSKRDVPGDPLQCTMAICRRLGMPEELQLTAQEEFASASCVHFGFEGNTDSIIGKLYLERAISAEKAAQARARAQTVLQHLAFKWDVLKNVHVVTRYLWHPFLEVPEIERRLEHVYREEGSAQSLQIARMALGLAAARAPAEYLQYLEVEETANERRSFDLNVYAANLQVMDLQQSLYRMRDHFGVRPGQFQALYDQIKNRALGHLAGGVHRNGRDFFNLYYGVVGFPRFLERFGKP